jgi:hypothetical protein
MIRSIINKIRNIIVKSQLLDAQTDNGLTYTISTSSFGQTNLSEVYYPYGYGASPHQGLGVELAISGHPENKVVFPYDPVSKWVGLNSGEVKIGNPKLNTSILFSHDGSIIINTTSAVIINGNLQVNGTISDSVGGLQAMRDTYNEHYHSDPQGGDTGTPNNMMD